MADVKISQLPEASSLSNSDLLPSVASSVTSKITLQNLAASMPEVSSSVSASYALTASFLAGAASGFPFTGSAEITGSLRVIGPTQLEEVTASNALFTGTITAQTIVVQTITSSVSFVTGSTKFGELMSNTHQFTGSVSITGSLLATASWATMAVTASVANYSRIQESQYRFQNFTVLDQDVWLNSGSIYRIVTSSGVNTVEYSLNGGSYSALSFTGNQWTGAIAVVPNDQFSWRITYRPGFTTGAIIVVSNIIVN